MAVLCCILHTHAAEAGDFVAASNQGCGLQRRAVHAEGMYGGGAISLVAPVALVRWVCWAGKFVGGMVQPSAARPPLWVMVMDCTLHELHPAYSPLCLLTS